jgi:predicted dehydrogenase
VRWYTSAKEMYADRTPEIVAICSPSGLHAEHVRTALEHDAHVFVEKPPASTVAQFHELTVLATQRDRLLTVVSQQRMEPQLRHIADVIRGGRLGSARLGELRLHWHRPQQYYEDSPWRATDPHGGSLANQGWHAADLMTWFLGPAFTVTAQTATVAHDIEVEDMAVATMRFSSGAMGSVVTTTAMPPGEPAEIWLYFERGSIGIRDTQVIGWNVPEGVPPLPPTQRAAAAVGSGASDPAAIGAIGHTRQWQDLVNAVRTGTSPAVTTTSSAHTLALIEAIYQAADTGAVVKVGGDWR